MVVVMMARVQRVDPLYEKMVGCLCLLAMSELLRRKRVKLSSKYTLLADR